MRSFDLAGFAAHLAKLPVLVMVEQHNALDHAAKVVEKTAKDKMGEYQGPHGPFAGWAELADSTKEERYRDGYPENEPELRSGLLRDSIEHQTDINEAIVGVPDKMVQHPYRTKPANIGDIAVAQELGTDHIPPRSFLGGAAAQKSKEVAEILGAGVVAALIGESVFNKRLPID